jgi:SprT protein
MQVSAEVKARVEAKLKECITIAEEHFGRTFKYPNVVYKKRGTTAGTAYYAGYELDFNSVLLMENEEAFLQRTVPHEMAHLITDQVYPSATTHGKEWKSVMVLLGAEPSRCHSYDTSNSAHKQQRHIYQCVACDKQYRLSTTRHNRLKKRAGTYVCKCAKAGKLQYIQSEHNGKKVADKKVTAPKYPRPGSKADKALDIYRDAMEADYAWNKHDFIYKFQEQLDMSYSGAQTYYYNTKKLYEYFY